MAGTIAFSHWTFNSDLHEAWHRGTGEAIRFTRAERALLNAFMENSGRILQRDLLLDAVADLDAEVADRSIDFIIHRLRRKLGDEPRDPRYIATQYGEGYVWVAEPLAMYQPASDAFLVVGPVRGLELSRRLADCGYSFARMLAREIDADTAKSNKVVLDRHCPPRWEFEGSPPEFSLALDFLRTENGTLDCVLSLRRFQTGSVIYIKRINIGGTHGAASLGRQVVTQMANDLVDAIWYASQASGEVAAAPDMVPMAVALHEASERLAGTKETWKDSTARLRRTLHEQPDNAEAQLMLAAALHSRYVLISPTKSVAAATRRHDEAEIEYLVQSALPQLQGNGLFALTASKLLYFVNKTHRALAMDLAEEAFVSTTAFANAFAIVAQLRMWEGDLESAIMLYGQGKQLARHGSYFHLYFLVLEMQAELALQCRHSPSAELLFSLEPAKRGELALLWAPVVTQDIRADVEAYMDSLDATAASAVIRHQYYLAARHFRHKAHRGHVVGRPAGLLVERFGPDVVPTDIRPDLPDGLIG